MLEFGYSYSSLVEELIAYFLDATARNSISPIMIQSKKYRRWQCRLDLKTCLKCLTQNGTVYDEDDDGWDRPFPPMHINCRCELMPLYGILTGTATTAKKDGADAILYHNGVLPDYYITKADAKAAGWVAWKGNLADVLPYMMIGGSVFHNDEQKLPDAPGRIWYEADINYEKGYRNSQRVLFSSDGLVFVTYDHYHSFYEIVGGSKW